MTGSGVEPWLRGTLTEVNPVLRGVLHALQLADEDLSHWCGQLADEELNQHPVGLPSVAYQLRHIARSLDRLLTYAEGRQLSDGQLAALKSESEEGPAREALFAEFTTAIQTSGSRVKTFARVNFEEARSVGRHQLPTTVGGLLVHVADHTQRHVGQAITTTKILLAQREGASAVGSGGAADESSRESQAAS